MARVDVEQSDAIDAVIRQLRSSLGLGERQCFETLDPMAPLLPKGGDFFVTVAVGPGQFPDGEQAAGNVTEESNVIVTAYSRIKLDSRDHASKKLTDASRGLLSIKKKLLTALVGQDLTRTDGSTFLRQWIFAHRADAPRYDEMSGLLSLAITFGVDFDWDITA